VKIPRRSAVGYAGVASRNTSTAVDRLFQGLGARGSPSACHYRNARPDRRVTARRKTGGQGSRSFHREAIWRDNEEPPEKALLEDQTSWDRTGPVQVVSR